MNDSIYSAKHLSDSKTLHPQTTDMPNNGEEAEYSRLTVEFENYHKSLSNYQSDLFCWLSNAKRYEQFVERVTEELEQFGLRDWGFTQIDKTKLARVETNSSGHTRSIFAHAFFECDIIMQHASMSDKPIYQSEIEAHIKAAPFLTEMMDRYLLMVTMIKQIGYDDILAIPITDALDGKRSLLCVTSKDMNTLDFKDKADECIDMLQILGRAVNDVFALKFAHRIVNAHERYVQLTSTQPFARLARMINHDLSKEETTSGVSLERLVKGITTVRKKILDFGGDK